MLVGAVAPLFRNWLVLAGAAVVYGVALYVVNFQILRNTIWNPQGPNQDFDVYIHAAFGLLLVRFFLGVRHRFTPRET